jgi:hypothetical protein
VPASDAREALLRVADRLCIELGYPDGEDAADAGSFVGGREQAQVNVLGAEDELLVNTVRRGLTQLAHGLGASEQAEASQRLVGAALDGAEMTMRGQLMNGHSEQLPTLLPSFVFLVALPIVQRDQAFELTRQTFELLEEVRREH